MTLPVHRLAGAQVLLVEDDLGQQRALARMLRRRGCHVTVAGQGKEALRLAAEDTPEAVVLDLGLPDMPGLEVCRQLRQGTATRAVPILVLTGATDLDTQVTALEAGADDFVQKPSHPLVLEARLSNLIIRHRAVLNNARLLRELERYVSSAARAQALQPRSLERLHATILFSDLRDSTAASFAGDPHAYAEAVRVVLGRQADIIRHWGGYVDKFTGDGMLAVFSDERSAWQACRAAHEIVRWARHSRTTDLGRPLPIGIGIHGGPVLRGDVGSDLRRDFTVMGPTVNVAARLCGSAGALDILVSEGVVEDAGVEFSYETLPPLLLKGLPGPLPARRLLAPPD